MRERSGRQHRLLPSAQRKRGKLLLACAAGSCRFTTEELAAATLDYFAANFGTWSVSEADKTLTQRYDGALRPNNEGADVRSSISLAGDELKLISLAALPTGNRIEIVYRRAK